MGRCGLLSLFGPDTSLLSLTEGPGQTLFSGPVSMGPETANLLGTPELTFHSKTLSSLLASALDKLSPGFLRLGQKILEGNGYQGRCLQRPSFPGGHKG